MCLCPNPRLQMPRPPGPCPQVCRATPLPGTAWSPRNAPSSELINLNAATLEQFIALPGIGTQSMRPALGLLSEFIPIWDISATFRVYY